MSRLPRRTFTILALAWPGFAIAAGGGGGGNAGLGTGGSSTTGTAPTGKDVQTVVPVRQFLNSHIRRVEKMYRANQKGGRVYRIDGFSKWFSEIIFAATLNDRTDTRRLLDAMRRIKTRARRKRFLDIEYQKAGNKHDAIRKTARDLNREERKAYRHRRTSAEARKKWQEIKAMSDQENARLERAKKHMSFIRTWRRHPEEGEK